MSTEKAVPYYITTPIYYLNGTPHLGHAYTTILADFMARFHKLIGDPTFFLTGTDEHGQKIAEAAAKANLTAKVHADQYSQTFRKMTALVGACPEDFIRTTDPRHKKGATALWRALTKKGVIYESLYKGWYAIRDEAFYKEADIKDGKAPTGAPVSWVEEPCYFFRLSAFAQPLLDHYAAHPDFISPKERRNEAIAWIKQGLTDLAISRSTFTWGIPVPDTEGHIMYVWIDALANYISALGYPQQTDQFKTFWPQAHHLLGKDILRFHAIYWPAFLMAAELPLPQKLFVHGWWTVEGEKMSKSLGNVLAPSELVALHGVDPLRYFVLRHITFGADGDFSQKAFDARFEADLANDLGNLFQRVLSFLQKLGGQVPQADTTIKAQLFLEGQTWLTNLHTHLTTAVKEATPHLYLEQLWKGIVLSNQFVDQLAPWKLAKSDQLHDKKKLETGLFILLETLYLIARYLQPVMPRTAAKMLAQLGIDHPKEPLKQNCIPLKAGDFLPKPAPLFPKKQG